VTGDGNFRSPIYEITLSFGKKKNIFQFYKLIDPSAMLICKRKFGVDFFL